MISMRKKMIVAGAILALAVSYLAYAGVKKGRSFYLTVDRYVADDQFVAENVRLHGVVDSEALVIQPDTQTAQFRLLGDSAVLPVVYQGILPDLFKAGSEVVIQGRRGPDGQFEASEVLTKCASKYTAHPSDEKASNTL